jgi:hypothetical protein
MIARPRELTLGRAASAASRDAARTAPLLGPLDRLDFDRGDRKALRLLL